MDPWLGYLEELQTMVHDLYQRARPHREVRTVPDFRTSNGAELTKWKWVLTGMEWELPLDWLAQDLLRRILKLEDDLGPYKGLMFLKNHELPLILEGTGLCNEGQVAVRHIVGLPTRKGA